MQHVQLANWSGSLLWYIMSKKSPFYFRVSWMYSAPPILSQGSSFSSEEIVQLLQGLFPMLQFSSHLMSSLRTCFVKESKGGKCWSIWCTPSVKVPLKVIILNISSERRWQAQPHVARHNGGNLRFETIWPSLWKLRKLCACWSVCMFFPYI